MKTFIYPHAYCPYCYNKMDYPTQYYCRKCGTVVTAGTAAVKNVDYRGIPICTCGGGPMFIKCSYDRCRGQQNIIPPDETAVVVIAGMRSSGKSTFLLDVVNSQSSKTGVIVSPKSRALIKWREENVKSMRESESYALAGNEIGADNFSSVISMQVCGKQSEMCLSLTDRPGEETQDLQKMLGLNYMFCADYIILFLDTLNIPGVASELSANGVQFMQNSESISNVTAIDSIITAVSTQRGKYGKRVPFMIGISKWDYIEQANLCPPGFSIGCNGADISSVLNEKRKFDKKKWKSNSNALRNFLIMHNESEIVNKAENYFRDVSYFAFSNFGSVPSLEGGLAKFPVHNPCHIMDPFYRILNDRRLI